ncbi:MAG: hypothetical protein KF773_08595 [Deltaproteobacteria bacterium]|nr:hypothetical protein [Deltaproteobacteria bacterium]
MTTIAKHLPRRAGDRARAFVAARAERSSRPGLVAAPAALAARARRSSRPGLAFALAARAERSSRPGLVAALAVALAFAVAGCAVTAPVLPSMHPARTSAPAGRLAGPPASLRPGVVAYPEVPAVRTEDEGGHHHHHHTP